MEAYDPASVFSSIDRHGRYAYDQQADIAQWNLARLAECLLPLIDPDSDKAMSLAVAVIEAFPERHERHWLNVMRDKLGLDPEGDARLDRSLATDFLDLLAQEKIDFTNGFRALFDAADGRDASLHGLFGQSPRFAEWQRRWQARQPQRSRRRSPRCSGPTLVTSHATIRLNTPSRQRLTTVIWRLSSGCSQSLPGHSTSARPTPLTPSQPRLPSPPATRLSAAPERCRRANAPRHAERIPMGL